MILLRSSLCIVMCDVSSHGTCGEGFIKASSFQRSHLWVCRACIEADLQWGSWRMAEYKITISFYGLHVIYRSNRIASWVPGRRWTDWLKWFKICSSSNHSNHDQIVLPVWLYIGTGSEFFSGPWDVCVRLHIYKCYGTYDSDRYALRRALHWLYVMPELSGLSADPDNDLSIFKLGTMAKPSWVQLTGPVCRVEEFRSSSCWSITTACFLFDRKKCLVFNLDNSMNINSITRKKEYAHRKERVGQHFSYLNQTLSYDREVDDHTFSEYCQQSYVDLTVPKDISF